MKFGWYLQTYIYDRTRNWLLMEHLLPKGLQRYLPRNCELFWDVKIKIKILEKPKKLKTETGTPFATELCIVNQ